MEINKIAKEIARLSSIEIDELSSVLMNEHNISATLYRFNSATLKSKECDLVLLDAGSLKLQMVKTIKETFGLGLKDAKTIVDSAPCYLKEFMDSDEAEKIKEEMESIGATIKIRYHDI
jgi:large subunit ribosomal protein L7/L12